MKYICVIHFSFHVFSCIRGDTGIPFVFWHSWRASIVWFDETRHIFGSISIGPSLVGMVDPTTQGCLHTHDEWMLFVASQDNPLFGSCLLDLCDHYIITCTDSNRQLARLCITLPKFNNMETENIYQPPAIPPAFPGPELCSSTATSPNTSSSTNTRSRYALTAVPFYSPSARRRNSIASSMGRSTTRRSSITNSSNNTNKSNNSNHSNSSNNNNNNNNNNASARSRHSIAGSTARSTTKSISSSNSGNSSNNQQQQQQQQQQQEQQEQQQQQQQPQQQQQQQQANSQQPTTNS